MANVKPMTDWYVVVNSDRKSPYRCGVVGNFLIDVRMNDENASALGVQVEGVKREDGTLDLTIISQDERYLIRSTHSGNPIQADRAEVAA